MNIVLCTIGFAGKTAEEFFALLQSAGVKHLMDIRQHRGGQLSGYAKHPDLAYFLQRVAGISYEHQPLLAPTPELLKKYRAGKEWEAYEKIFLSLLKERGVPQSLSLPLPSAPLALLCSEAGPEKCHRRLVADRLAEVWRGQGHSVEVRHLVSEKYKPPRKKNQPRKK
jgi:uncharacterized protein (DUF488 family)